MAIASKTVRKAALHLGAAKQTPVKAVAKTARNQGKVAATESTAQAIAITKVVTAQATPKAKTSSSVQRALQETSVGLPIDTLEPTAIRPAYWDKACADLVKRDRILKKVIPKFGPVHLVGRGEPFVTLARSIVGQQISVKAAQTVWQRVQKTCPKLTPKQFLKLDSDTLAQCGLSKRKAEYILDLAQHFVSGALHVDKWVTMDDEAVIIELTQIRGIGRWTAEMFLIFNLLRPNVLPLDDVGLIRAISLNYFSGEPVTRSEAREVAANWEPWRTVATWYMWRSLDPLPVDY
ncbi:DNA glycosylase protein [Mycoavidus cysteinexigens]|uniref:DNA-3-methyladenine glycosylase II n=1 Tax=Mycoavidus cysteinexigens TaxID=1553431 RepID=A0A2Z6EUU9_9BURK|nr:DNA-3-methyladenine glycosylase [Mycoavidus cysteinexigens]BBE09239.1 DNA glycosylase protein [Mycoavidus cysteinexigens]GLR02103.1 base excision DNA repair protein [Mycoavidus cysteinexigens]